MSAEQKVRELADRIAKEVGAQPADVYVVACVEVAVRVLRQGPGEPSEREAIGQLLDVVRKMQEQASSDPNTHQ